MARLREIRFQEKPLQQARPQADRSQLAPAQSAPGARAPRSFQDTALWKLKERLQFTGWLQYIAPTVVATLFALLALIAWLFGGIHSAYFWVPTALAGVLVLIVATDLVTVKLGIHPSDAIPLGHEELDAFDLMRYRRSCRSFQPRNLTEAHRAHLLDSVRRNTKSDALLGTGPIRFEYVAATLTVWPTVGCHEFLVAIAPNEYDRKAVVDVGRSLQHVVLDVTRLGVATCWIGPGADHDSIRSALGNRFDADRDHIICLCAVGYKSRWLPMLIRVMQVFQHRRRPIPALFYADPEQTQPLEVADAPFDAFDRTYEVCQWSPSSFNGQPTRCVGQRVDVDGKGVARFDFSASTASRYYAPVALGIWCANWETGCEALDIPGHFVSAPPNQRRFDEDGAVPHYDVSWLQDSRA